MLKMFKIKKKFEKIEDIINESMKMKGS